jgi:hypothetical protein
MDALWLVPPVVAAEASRAEPETALAASHLASVRLRAGVAALDWQRAGHRNILLNPEDPAAVAGVDFAAAALCIVGKFFLDSEPAKWLAACSRVESSGGRVLLDVCDYPFAEKPPPVTRFYTEALARCDALTVNSVRIPAVSGAHARCAGRLCYAATLPAEGRYRAGARRRAGRAKHQCPRRAAF